MPNGYMSMGGRSIPVPGGGVGNPGYQQYDEDYMRYVEELKRQNEEAKNSRPAGRILQEMYGAQNAGGISRDGGRPGMMSGAGPGVGGGGAPFSSEMGALNYSYKTRGDAPRYHEEIPYGGTPGVWAIRNDELGGPKPDPFQNMSPRDFAEYTKRSIGNRFTRRRGR